MKNYKTESDFNSWWNQLVKSPTLEKYKDWFKDYWFYVQDDPDEEPPFKDSFTKKFLSCKEASLISSQRIIGK